MGETLVENDILEASKHPRISTLHSESHRILRNNHEKAGLPSDFFVINMDETMVLVEDAAYDLGWQKGKYALRKLKRKIDRMKDDNMTFVKAPMNSELKKLYEGYCTSP